MKKKKKRKRKEKTYFGEEKMLCLMGTKHPSKKLISFLGKNLGFTFPH